MRHAFALLAIASLASCGGYRPIEGERFATVGSEEVRDSRPVRTRELLDGNHELTLEAATVMALEGNRDLAVRRLDPIVAGTFEAIERGEFGLTVFADAQHRQELGREQVAERSRGGRYRLHKPPPTDWKSRMWPGRCMGRHHCTPSDGCGGPP